MRNISKTMTIKTLFYLIINFYLIILNKIRFSSSFVKYILYTDARSRQISPLTHGDLEVILRRYSAR